MVNQNYSVSGLTCDACVKLIKKRLEKLSGVSDVEVDKDGQKLSISSDAIISESEINDALAGTDYRVTV